MNKHQIAQIKTALARMEEKEGKVARDRLVRNIVNARPAAECKTVDRSTLNAQLNCKGLGATAGRELWFYVMAWLLENNKFDDAIDWEAE